MNSQRLSTTKTTPNLDHLRTAYHVSQEAAGCSPKTLVNIGCAFNALERFMEVRAIEDVATLDATAMRQFIIHERTRGQSDRSIQTYLITLKAFFRWCLEESLLPDNPLARVKPPRVEKKIIEAFTDEEIGRLLAATGAKDAFSIRNRALVVCLLDSGLRASEFVGMKVGDIDLQTGLFLVTGKGRKQRHVRLGAYARKCLIRYMNEFPAAEGTPLWLGVRGRVTPSGLLQILTDLGATCGVTPCNPHKFRRTFALSCLRNGMDPFSLQILMGHADLQILRRYLAQTTADIQKAHERCSPMDSLRRPSTHSGRNRENFFHINLGSRKHR